MKLVDLNPSWIGAGGEGITRDGQPVPERHGVGITFDCPCGGDLDAHGGHAMKVFVAFSNPLDGGLPYANEKQPTWERTGDTFETLTLRPSIQRVGGCAWHGFVTNGEVA